MGVNTTLHIESEIGTLKGVILHSPGKEVENMTPKNVERALYSDILNLAVVSPEYDQLQKLLEAVTTVYQVRQLLEDILGNEKVKHNLVARICRNEASEELIYELVAMSPADLARDLIEGVILKKDNLTRFLSKEYYALRPLHNFFYTRDAAAVLPGGVLIGKMANHVRDRETLIMKAIMAHHPALGCPVWWPNHLPPDKAGPITIEGGDLLVARHDILLVGIGTRTTTEGVDFLIDHYKRRKAPMHIIVQELPHSPESFIHLDMAFTFLDTNACMVYAPLVLKPNRYQTVHITIDNGKVARIEVVPNLLSVLKQLGMDLEPICCGSTDDTWFQEREQWHSGANFFAFGPGKVVGYARNIHTLEAMSRHGFDIVAAADVISGRKDLSGLEKLVVTIEGSELPRGGGGCRCMTLPIQRQPVLWS